MKLLVDSSLPKACDGVLRDGVELIRYGGTEVTDQALVREAAAQGCTGVVFLGRRIIGQRGLLDQVQSAGLVCVVVSEDEPNRAGEHLLANLELIRRHGTAPSILVVLAREVESLRPPDEA